MKHHPFDLPEDNGSLRYRLADVSFDRMIHMHDVTQQALVYVRTLAAQHSPSLDQAVALVDLHFLMMNAEVYTQPHADLVIKLEEALDACGEEEKRPTTLAEICNVVEDSLREPLTERNYCRRILDVVCDEDAYRLRLIAKEAYDLGHSSLFARLRDFFSSRFRLHC